MQVTLSGHWKDSNEIEKQQKQKTKGKQPFFFALHKQLNIAETAGPITTFI